MCFQWPRPVSGARYVSLLQETSATVYDAASDRTPTTNRNNWLAAYSFDALGREGGASWAVSARVPDVKIFRYDAPGNQLTGSDTAGGYRK